MATDDTTTDRWLPIPGWEGLYDVSSLGRVRGRRGIKVDWADKDGYRRVSLYRGRSRSNRSIHALVLEAFVGPRPPGQEACHNNGDRADNRLDNLRWDTPSANQLDSVDHGTHRNARKEECPRGHALREPNLVPSKARRGRRNCLACARALAYVHLHPDRDLRATADEYYTRIIGQARS